MSNNEAKRLIQEALQRRKEKRREEEREAQLEHYEVQQLLAVSRNCADARKERAAEQISQDTARLRAVRRAEKAQERIREQQRESMAIDAVKNYIIMCFVILCVAAVSPLPIWAAIALIVSGMAFPAAHIFRIYNPF